ncbi:MAG: hypothetical protein ACREBU_22550, partial [Nitrososphaera sp.]
MKQIFERFKVPEVRPLMVTGVALVVFAAILTWAFLLRPGSPAFILKLDREGIYLVTSLIGPVVLFYLVTGLGIMFPRKWGYYLFRAFLYIHLFVGFPITTILAYRGLSYVRAPSIKRHFGVSIELHEPTALSQRTKVILILIGTGFV